MILSDVDIKKFLEGISAAQNRISEPAPMSFFVKELGWVHAKFVVPVISTDGINYMDVLAMDGSFHKIKEEYIIDQRTTIVTPELLEQFIKMMEESMEVLPEEDPAREEMYG